MPKAHHRAVCAPCTGIPDATVFCLCHWVRSGAFQQPPVLTSNARPIPSSLWQFIPSRFGPSGCAFIYLPHSPVAAPYTPGLTTIADTCVREERTGRTPTRSPQTKYSPGVYVIGAPTLRCDGVVKY
ncbi:hypothetical protein E2C01_011245 [Portunus trituberculatus]|uniref:Uncharacterized protein n=1 Tax=Portunus trituberculatus TaxID=210409 RepID=A0A5B7DB77_PORTR|nr:hypothetical protein [Portunus trituberculatus]